MLLNPEEISRKPKNEKLNMKEMQLKVLEQMRNRKIKKKSPNPKVKKFFPKIPRLEILASKATLVTLR